MARIRSIKPEFWDDRKLARSATRDARMLYMGLWNQADEHSRLNGDVVWIKGRVFPYDDDIDPTAISGLLDELESAGRIVRYDHDGDPFIFLPKLGKHQRLEPAKVDSRLPAPPTDPNADGSESRADESAQTAESSALLYVAGSREQGAGVARAQLDAAPPPPSTGEDLEPSQFCPQHPNGTTANCGRCAGARKVHDRWAARATKREAAKKAATRAVIDACSGCDEHGRVLSPDDGKILGFCDHPDVRGHCGRETA